jgi:HK97 family phage portal protein
VGLARLLTRSDVAATPVAGSASPSAIGPPPPTDTGPGGWYPPPTAVLPAPSERTALAVPAFWRGHAYVCGGIGLLPVGAFRDTEELDPQPPLVRQPDPNQTPMAFWAGVTSALTLYGNSICVITGTDRLGYPTSLYPVHPLYAAVRFAGNPSDPLIAGWYLAGHFYDPSQVWHVKSHLGRPGWPLGRGLLDAVPDGIALAGAVQGYAETYFASGGMPTGVLKIHRPEITQDQADTAKTNWVAKYAGTNSVAVLNELTDFTPIAYKPVDSQMIESRALTLTDVALMWGLPPTKLGSNVGGSTYKNAEMEEIQARNDALQPWASLLEQAVSINLLPRGQHAEWNMDAKLRADTLTRYQAYQFALGGPGPASQWMLVDEVRGLENLDAMAAALDDAGAQATLAEQGGDSDVEPVVGPTSGGPGTGNTTEQLAPASPNGSIPTTFYPAPEQGMPLGTTGG